MKFSISWLKDYLETQATLDEIVETMTNIGLEVEHVEDRANDLRAFTVAEILKAEHHPNADRLQLCEVETIEGIKSIVCGAPNARKGIKVVYAPLGTYLPGADFCLDKKPRKIRGVESHGMLCSATELGIGDDHSGIIEISGEWSVGEMAATALGVDDPVIDFEVTPNRPDWNGINGIARDLAVAGLGILKRPPAVDLKTSKKTPIGISIADKKACPIFAGRLIRNVKNGPSPKWLQDKMQAVGLKSINKLVDVTNYFSQDQARPLHVYDADKLTGNIHVRLANNNEKLEALDGNNYALDNEICVICDESGVIGLGGVMGGMSTRSLDDTVSVFVESALFDPKRTMQTGRKTGIISDARYRFERGVDPQSVFEGLDRACEMIVDLCGGEIHDVNFDGELSTTQTKIAFDYKSVEKLTGIAIDEVRAIEILTKLGCEATKTGSSNYEVSIPTHRPDMTQSADLVEEVLRIYGYDKIPSSPMPPSSKPNGQSKNTLLPVDNSARIGRTMLSALGYQEMVNWSFCLEDHAQHFTDGKPVKLKNPISTALNVMRPIGFASMLPTILENIDRGFDEFSLFEIGPAYLGPNPGDQRQFICMIQSVKQARHWSTTLNRDVFSIKSDVEKLLSELGIDPNSTQISKDIPRYFHPGYSGSFQRGPANRLAVFGQLHPKTLKLFGIVDPVLAAQIDLTTLSKMVKKVARRQSKPLKRSDRMTISRDLAFLVDKQIPAANILAAAKKADKKRISAVKLFDHFEGPSIGDSLKSIAIEVQITPFDENLTDDEIDKICQQVVDQVTKETKAELRGQLG